jgi:alpha-L-fucosidase
MYAEWYDFYLRNPANATSPTWAHHLATYGPSVDYEDFIGNFTASKFDAGKWVDLFVGAGARYFVVVTVRVVFFLILFHSTREGAEVGC